MSKVSKLDDIDDSRIVVKFFTPEEIKYSKEDIHPNTKIKL
jgi:hypothetical protein